MRRVDDQVHEHLVELPVQAHDRRERRELLDDVGLVFHFMANDVEGGLQANVQIGLLPVRMIDA
ncbi:hypothetical protein FQZ97_873420 [compost metagenome]